MTEFVLMAMGVLAAVAIGVVFYLANDVLANRATGRAADGDQSQARHG